MYYRLAVPSLFSRISSVIHYCFATVLQFLQACVQSLKTSTLEAAKLMWYFFCLTYLHVKIFPRAQFLTGIWIDLFYDAIGVNPLITAENMLYRFKSIRSSMTGNPYYSFKIGHWVVMLSWFAQKVKTLRLVISQFSWCI